MRKRFVNSLPGWWLKLRPIARLGILLLVLALISLVSGAPELAGLLGVVGLLMLVGASMTWWR